METLHAGFHWNRDLPTKGEELGECAGPSRIQWCARTDCFGACDPSASLHSARPAGDRRRCAASSNRLVVLGGSNQNAKHAVPNRYS
jgi:hypothetical protein